MCVYGGEEEGWGGRGRGGEGSLVSGARDRRRGGGAAGRLALPAQQGPEGAPVARAHDVVDGEVPRGVEEGKHVDEPEAGQSQVVVAPPRVEVRQEQPNEPWMR